MAAEFLRSHGIDIDAELDRIQGGEPCTQATDSQILNTIQNVRLPGTAPESIWNLFLQAGHVKQIENFTSISSTSPKTTIHGNGGLLAPSLCHPHIHLDKAYLLSHPKYADLCVEKGGFQEAMALTGSAKARFDREDLLERGQRVIDESITAGVTHMRAFVEVDAGVRTKCLEAGILLKQKAEQERRCTVQLCAFAQLPLFSAVQDDEDGSVIRSLIRQALSSQKIDTIGSTPYVEADRSRMESNVNWLVDLSIEFNAHLDFHLDYNLDANTEPLIWHVIQALKNKGWKDRTLGRTIVFGHCTRLTLFDSEQWHNLATEIMEAELPVSFVGLPTSDLFMMRMNTKPEVRGTLDIITLIREYNLNACIGVNNIGNAFTPQGTCDPLSLACQGVGIYQAGTKRDTELLFECVSTRARTAIGLSPRKRFELDIKVGDDADFVLLGTHQDPNDQWRTRKTVSEAVYLYDHGMGRRALRNGKLTTSDKTR